MQKHEIDRSTQVHVRVRVRMIPDSVMIHFRHLRLVNQVSMPHRGHCLGSEQLMESTKEQNIKIFSSSACALPKLRAK